jgi:hypothetical protein
MPTYRVFFLDTNNHISLPAETVEADDDQEATIKARKFIDGKDIELWEGARFIVRFPHK